MTQTYLEKHVEELTNRVIILEKMVAHLLYADPNIKKQNIKIPYPTPKRTLADYEDTNTEPDPMFDEVWKAISKAGKVSTSYLQRKFALGYNRSAKLMEQLEREGVIGPSQDLKPRTILKPYPST